MPNLITETDFGVLRVFSSLTLEDWNKVFEMQIHNGNGVRESKIEALPNEHFQDLGSLTESIGNIDGDITTGSKRNG